MVLNQAHPSRCATSNPSQQGHLPGAWGCRHRRRQGFAAIFRSDASLPDWLEGGGGPLANTSSQKLGAWAARSRAARAPWQPTGGQDRPEVYTPIVETLKLGVLRASTRQRGELPCEGLSSCGPATAPSTSPGLLRKARRRGGRHKIGPTREGK